jgi:S-disulfanyl-L-cysteine oxidoreductase SoxD
VRSTPYLALMGLWMTISGCKVGQPGGLETRTVDGLKHRVMVGNKSVKNPVTFTPEHLTDGKEAFGHYCVACHGLDGQNTGVPFAEHMSPPLPSLASAEVQEYTDGQLKWVIDNGISPSGMPASKDTLSEDEIWSIVLFLRHLPPAGSLGEPEFYSH